MELNEFFGSMINMDDPKHFRLRSLVAKGFTPKEVAKVEGYVTTKAAGVVDRMLERIPPASATSSSGSPRRCRCRSSAR